MNKPFNIELIKLEKGLNEFLGRDGLAATNDNLHSKDCQMWHFVRKVFACHRFNLPYAEPCIFKFIEGRNFIEQIFFDTNCVEDPRFFNNWSSIGENGRPKPGCFLAANKKKWNFFFLSKSPLYLSLPKYIDIPQCTQNIRSFWMWPTEHTALRN